jgi:hypothetical protein
MRVSRRTSEITPAYLSLQVVVRVFGGSSEGEGGTPLPLESPLDYPYYMWGLYGAPLPAVVEGVFCSGR